MDKEFDKVFSELCRTRNSLTVWHDFITISAIAISNANDFQQKREDVYLRTVKQYGKDDAERLAHLLARTVLALSENQERDFLGKLYMGYNFGNRQLGQVYTPYHMASLMSELAGGFSEPEEIEKQGWTSVYDPTCGSGVLLIAAANHAKTKNINYQNKILFFAQDLDRCSALMCYIQLSLLCCPGYVVIGDSLANPPEGNILFAPKDAWITPMYFNELWTFRRLLENPAKQGDQN